MSYQRTRYLFDYISWQRFFMISLAVSGVIGCAIGYKWLQLSGGGKRVAEQLGGHRIAPNTNDIDEKKILNVVEEMAIASGMPVPSVYLLADEMGINAFAAGSSPADAVIGVTRGCIDQFDRQQLQGVIAHEFSHILNGDMRLNIRLIAILHGILFIGLIGRMLLQGNHRRRDKNSLAALGFGLLAIGGLGQFFGNWIKSAVGRQREFLADASAVQFTRNPAGIANALKIIGGYQCHSQLQSSQAEAMSHLFFGQALNKVSRLFASHPPLEERIQRIEPAWDGHFIFREPKINKAGSSTQSSSNTGAANRTKNFAADSDFNVAAVAAAGQVFIDTGSLDTI
ncbi:MAG: M48 family metallopeptidase, partial [Porticoccus sp.]|nr:M48 family metallopeptidase [Porticoccus sp.]